MKENNEVERIQYPCVPARARLKANIRTHKWTVNRSSISLSNDTSDYESMAAAVLEVAKSARIAASSCRSAIEIAVCAVSNGQKSINTALDYAGKVHSSHVPHYLGMVTKYRNAINLVSDSVCEAEKAEEEADTAANNATEAGVKLSGLAFSKVTKDKELWATWTANTLKTAEIDAYKASYDVLRVTLKFWEEAEEAIDMDTSFNKSIQSPDGTWEWKIQLIIVSFILGWTFIIVNFHLNIENDSQYILFMIGCFLIVGSTMMGILKIINYSSDKNSEEKMVINRTRKEIKEHLTAISRYFEKNNITPPTSDSSEEEVVYARGSDEIPLIEISRN